MYFKGLVIFLLCLVSSQMDPVTAEGDLEAVSKANTKFASSLYEVLKKDHPENLIFSPFSLSSVLAMCKAGADGVTAQEIQQSVYFPNDENLFNGYQKLLSSLKSNENFTLEAANRIYPKDGFEMKKEFVNILSNYFQATIEQLDYGQPKVAANKINQWVERATRDKIKDLFSPDNFGPMTKLVLVNAIYFKGAWATKFDASQTKKAPFYVDENTAVDVDQMSITTYLPYRDFTSELDAKAIAIPYKGNRLSMIILLPNKRTGLADLEIKLKTWDLSGITKELFERKVYLQLPKFRLESTIKLEKPLAELGLKTMFSPDNANFSKIAEDNSEKLYVSKAIQKAFIEVNEEGSEAAAATGSTIRSRRSVNIDEDIAIKIDHPFIFFILHLENNNKLKPLVILQGFFNAKPEMANFNIHEEL